MSRPRVISVGKERHAFPREDWGWLDHEREREWMDSIGAPLPHGPGGGPPDLKFSLFERPVIGGSRSKAIDEAIAKHTGRRVR